MTARVLYVSTLLSLLVLAIIMLDAKTAWRFTANDCVANPGPTCRMQGR